MSLEQDIFQRTKIDFNQLIAYGFQKECHQYVYIQNILDNSFQVVITINTDEDIHGKMIDLAFHEEYINFRIKAQTGEFITKIRQEYEKILNDIKDKCTTPQYFIYPQANRIADYIIKTYHDYPDFPWTSDPHYGVFRHHNNQKWYALMMNINKNKITSENGDVEIINLKLKEEHILQLLQENGFYKAYHMNKKKWISIILDETLSDEDIFKYIDESYQLTQTIHTKTKKDVIQ